MTIPISQAYLCAEGHVTSNSGQCDCGSRSLYSLANILDRDTTDYYREFIDLLARPSVWEN